MSSNNLIYINSETVQQLLKWESVVNAIEHALLSVSSKRAFQNPRTFTNVSGTKNVLLCMPGYLKTDKNGILACKMVTAFKDNENKDPPLPSILANIFLFNENTGQLKAIIEANEITAWRTAAASVVATKYLHCNQSNRNNDILSILGAGTQGRIHAIAFHNFFKFKEVRIWNHRNENAQKLCKDLIKLGIPAICMNTGLDCVKNADVIVTATYATSPILEFEWVKKNVHINAIGAGITHYSELSPTLYRNSIVFVDDLSSAKVELRGLEEELRVPLTKELGEIILGNMSLPDPETITVFQSLGMAAEDAAVGQLIYDCYLSEKN